MNGGNLVQEFMLFVGLLAIAYEFTFYCTLTDFFSLCRERFNCLTLCVLYQFSYQTYVQISATSLKMILCISPPLFFSKMEMKQASASKFHSVFC